ncbi:MAG: nuclear transport factor 2 family protein [Gammaproteobacteria bacterium]|jgi:ketosteroid isomerase-like protein
MTISKEIVDDIISLLKQCEFRKICDRYCADDFLWTIKGSSVLSGPYKSKDDFFERVIGRLNKVLLPEWKMHILDYYVDNDRDIFVVEMRGEMTAKNGADYNNEYCWIFKFSDNKIISITAYYDSLLVNKTLNENEVRYE